MASHKYEFFGPPGAFVVTTSISIITYLTYFLLTPSGSPPPAFLSSPLTYLQTALSTSFLFHLPTLALFLAYFGFTVLLQYVLPGPLVPGVVLANGKRNLYKLNALYTSLTIFSLLAGATLFFGGANWVGWVYLWDHHLHLITALNLFCISLSTFLYIYSLRPGPHLLAEGGTSPSPLFNWFIGRELNPRPLLSFLDLKSFCELRPGLTLWIILNISNTMHQLRTTGSITDSMILVNLFQGWYVLDSHFHEPAVLTTMDITTDGFGHMLVFGDLAWLPITYSIQTRYLALNPVHLGLLGVLAVLAINGLGYYIFRASNSQKNLFRTNPSDPKVVHLKTLQTKRGTKLLISGWWGTSRHINYLGDWVMAWAWCLPTGFGTPLTYFYVVYFAILLLHRERRDDESCERKYGEDWGVYRRIVRWRIVPGVY
ncbi:Delta(14)-sterol reductase [Terfezia claveryi]|nr:Delta(14)-sterol reductase [Terfezia claveryi]